MLQILLFKFLKFRIWNFLMFTHDYVISCIVRGAIAKKYFFFLFIQGAYFAWKATAMGKNFVNGKTFLEKRYVPFL